jgi:hypothetical protein
MCIAFALQRPSSTGVVETTRSSGAGTQATANSGGLTSWHVIAQIWSRVSLEDFTYHYPAATIAR